MYHGLGENLAVNERRDRLLFRILECCLQLLRRFYLVCLQAEGRRVHRKVHGDEAAVKLPGLRVAEAELRTVATLSMTNLEVVDAAVRHVVKEDNVDLDPLRNRCGKFGVEHHVACITDERIDLTIRCSEANTKRCIQLVTHAGETILNMIAVDFLRAPCTLQVARETARRTDDDGVLVDRLIKHTEHTRLKQ